MYINNNKKHFILLLIAMQFLFSGCNHHEIDDQVRVAKSQASPHSRYTINLPANWHEVLNKEDITKCIFWHMTNANYTKFIEHPSFRAWQATDEANTFLTLMSLKRHCGLGIGHYFNQTKPFLQNTGWIIHETGTTKIGGAHCKWWIQSHSNADIQQQCYMFGHEDTIYVLVGSAPYISKDKQKLFEQIAHSITYPEAQ